MSNIGKWNDENMKPLKITLLTFFLFLHYSTTAQIVNIENKRNNRIDSVAWFGNLTAGVNLFDNGKTVLTIRSGANIERRQNRHTFLSFTKYNLGRIDKSDFLNDGFQHFRYNYHFKKRWTWEAFTQAQYNEKTSLRLRWLIGTGPRIELFQDEKYKMFFGLMYMYEYNEEKRKESVVINYDREHRASSYLSFDLKPTKNLRITSITYFQPVVTDFEDLRLSSQTSLGVNITEQLLLSVRFNILYDSKVPELVPNTIYSLDNGLRLNF